MLVALLRKENPRRRAILSQVVSQQSPDKSSYRNVAWPEIPLSDNAVYRELASSAIRRLRQVVRREEEWNDSAWCLRTK
jgi:hypothetical protein